MWFHLLNSRSLPPLFIYNTQQQLTTTHIQQMFASRRIHRGGTVCFSDLDRAARLTEIVEAGRPFYDWVKANNKAPKYFADWKNVIAEYHRENGTVWTEPIAVNSPYGYMGYDLIKPPKEPMYPVQFGTSKSGLVTFSDDEMDDDDFIDSDSELSLIEDSDDEEEEEKKAGKYSHLSERAATFMEGLDKAAITIQCWYRRLMAQFQVKGRAKLREMAAAGVTELYIKDMPYGTSLVDVPGGIVINFNEEDIIFGDEFIVTSDEEEEEEPIDAAPWVEKYASEEVKEAIRVDKEADELELIPESDDDELSELSEIEDLSDIEITDE